MNVIISLKNDKLVENSTYRMSEEYFLRLGGPISKTVSTVSEYPSDGTLAFRHASCDVLTFKAVYTGHGS